MRRLFLLVMMLCLFGVGAYLAYTSVTLPNVRQALEDGVEPIQTSQIVARDETVLLTYGKFHYEPVPLKDINPVFVEALIATEDRRFYNHMGVDPIGVLRAVFVNLTSKGLHQGASTITQQLARNIFLTNERSFQRKIKEILLAFKIEHQLSKEEILELYLNNIYFGEGAYGIGAASYVYFGKTPSALSVPEAALLAGMPQAPSLYNPYINTELAKKRRNEVLQNLVEVGKLDQGSMQAYSRQPILVRRRSGVAGGSVGAYFSRYALEEACKILDVEEQDFWQQGFKVVTTLDPQAQRLAEQAARSANSRYGRSGSKDQYALMSLNNRGEVIAYIGGKDFSVSQYDRVTHARRQAGSLFKVFVYTAAVEAGMVPKTVYNDEPVVFEEAGNWKPENYDHHHYGLMTLAQAFARSNNVVAAKLINDIRPGPVVRVAHKMGIESSLSANLSLALGSPDVSLKEMTTAFSVFPNMGHLVEPFVIQKIYDHKGRLIYKNHAQFKAVLNRQTRDTMVELMSGVNEYGTGKAAKIGAISAGKTGTSDEYRNAWYIGYTPSVTTGVWVGDDDNRSMPGITGGTLPAVIWHQFMASYTPALAKQGFELVAGHAVTHQDFFEVDLKNLSESDKQRLKDKNVDVAALEQQQGDSASADDLNDEDPNAARASESTSPAPDGSEAQPSEGDPAAYQRPENTPTNAGSNLANTPTTAPEAADEGLDAMIPVRASAPKAPPGPSASPKRFTPTGPGPAPQPRRFGQ